jgi:hypothetical protein
MNTYAPKAGDWKLITETVAPELVEYVLMGYAGKRWNSAYSTLAEHKIKDLLERNCLERVAPLVGVPENELAGYYRKHYILRFEPLYTGEEPNGKFIAVLYSKYSERLEKVTYSAPFSGERERQRLIEYYTEDFRNVTVEGEN